MKNLIIVLIILVLILIIGLGVFIFSVYLPTKSASGDSLLHDEVIGYNTGSDFISTLKNSRRIIKADIVIEVQNKQDEKILQKFNYRVRDCILSILGDIDEEDINSDNFKDNLKMEIKNALQNMLGIDSIKGIYFNEFVIQ